MASDDITLALRSSNYLERYYENTGRKYATGQNTPCPNAAAHKTPEGHARIYEDENGAHVKCYGCNTSWDIFSLYGLDNGIDVKTSEGFKKAKAALCAMFGIEQGKGRTSGGARVYLSKDKRGFVKIGGEVATHSQGAARPAAKPSGEAEQEAKPDAATREYITKCAIAYHAGEGGEIGRAYMNGRGISDETARRFGVGYDPKAGWINGKRDGVIIPYGHGYTVRFLHPQIKKDGKEVKAMSLPKRPSNVKSEDWRIPFNLKALFESAKSNTPVFLVEGELDALSIAEVGGVAVAFGGLGNVRKIVKSAKKISAGVYIPCCDRDQKGEKAQAKLESELSEIDGAVVFKDAPKLLMPDAPDGTHPKDANDALCENRAEFAARVAEVVRQATAQAERERSPFNRVIGSGDNAILLRRFCDIPPTPEQDKDPNALIKGAKVAALSKGEGWIIAGEPGAGKSSFAQQFMFCAGAGKECFGFEFTRPLHVLYLQSELQNHKLRLAENSLAYGLRTAYNWNDEEIIRALENVVYDEFSIGKVCEDLAAHLTRIFAVYPFDLLVIDPLITYADGDLSLQKDAKAFFKDVWRLIGGRAFKVNDNPVKFGVIILHHTGKDNIGKDGKRVDKGQFATAGSYVINAWPRFELILRKFGKRVYTLKAEKNPEDGASWKNAEEEFTDTFYIKRAGRGERYWTAATEEEINEAKQGDTPTMTAEEKQIKKQEEDGERVSKGLADFLEHAKSESENGRHLSKTAASDYCRRVYGRTIGEKIYTLFKENIEDYHFKLSKPHNGRKYFIYSPDAPKLEIRDEPSDTPDTSQDAPTGGADD